MIEVRVLEFDRLGKAYVVDPKTLDVYETDSIAYDPLWFYGEKGTIIGIKALLVTIIFYVAIEKISVISVIIARILYIGLLVCSVLFAKFISFRDRYFYDIKDLKLVDKRKNSFQIAKFSKNIMGINEQVYYIKIFASVLRQPV